MRVYLSRSNAADPAVFSKVEQELRRFGHTIVTFAGGRYSNSDLLACDALVIVPPSAMLPDHGGGFTKLSDISPNIGPGQYKQIAAALEDWAGAKEDDDGDYPDAELPDDKYIAVVHKIGMNGLELFNFNALYRLDSDNDDHDPKIGYGYVDLQTNNPRTISELFGDESVNQYMPSCNSAYSIHYPSNDVPMLATGKLFGMFKS